MPQEGEGANEETKEMKKEKETKMLSHIICELECLIAKFGSCGPWLG